MKPRILLVLIAFLVVHSVTGLAQCHADPKSSDVGEQLRVLSVNLLKAEEIGMSIKASIPGGSWKMPDHEGAVLSVFVNAKYAQDVILFAGSDVFEYKVLIGKVEKGKNEISIRLNTKRSAKSTRKVKIVDVSVIRPKFESELDRVAVENAPYIYVRPDVVDRFSDIALLSYYEILPNVDGSTKIRYTTIFTNEDGGTQSRALMARWGRMTDIEWVYEITLKDGKFLSETIQGENHQVQKFNGKRVFGSHPLIYDTTVNNNFSDKGCSSIRTSSLPIPTDLTSRSRETVMDDNSWTYRIMTEEAEREGRVDGKNMGINTIDDLRNYLFVEVSTQNAFAAVSVEAVTKTGEVFYSDLQDPRLRVGRPGYQRIAVHFPHPTADLASLNLMCYQLSNASNPSGSCGISLIVGFRRLNKDLSLQKTPNRNPDPKRMNPSEKIVWKMLR